MYQFYLPEEQEVQEEGDFDSENEEAEADGSEGSEGDGSSDGEEEVLDYAATMYEIISKYSENPLELSTFSTGGELDPTIGVPAVTVQNVGRVGYPLSTQQAAALVNVATQAPFGKGTETVVDVDVRRAWQIDSSLVTINQQWLQNSLPKLVAECCAKLGIDSVAKNVRANFYKMLLYEEGGHFKKHRDTEKEAGMFGSLLIQLPSEHQGGHLLVEHEGKTKRFAFDQDSADKAFYACLYADCEHLLEPVTQGLRLVLAFNLVRGLHTAVDATLSAPTSAHRKGYDEALVTATKAWCADVNGPQKLVKPLSHHYTRTNVSFAGLKGDDQKALSLLQQVRDPLTNKKLFSVYLALVTKHVTGTGDEDGGYDRYDRYNRYGGGYGGGGGGGVRMSSDCDIDTSYETDSWVGPQGAVDLRLKIDFHSEVLTAQGLQGLQGLQAAAQGSQEDERSEVDIDEMCENMFPAKPDKVASEGYMGNYAGSVEYWYHSAVLVFWPASRDFDIKLAVNAAEAVALLQHLDPTSAEFANKLDRVLAHQGGAGNQVPIHSVLPLLQNEIQARDMLDRCCKRTLSEADARAVVAVVLRFGLSVLGNEFAALVASQSLKMITVLLGLAQQMLFAATATPSAATSSTTASTSASSAECPMPWCALVHILVAAVLKSTCTAVPDADWVAVTNFVAAHCEAHDQSAVAAHLGTRLALRSLNHLIAQLVNAGPQGVFLQDHLKRAAVQACVRSAQQPAADVTTVVEWVVRGQHAELMTTLAPRLQSWCGQPELFRAVFALPVVVDALQRDTPVTQQLEAIVQARIAKITPHCTPPPFSWCMPGVANPSSKPEVGPFLAGPQQQMVLSGFNGIGHARNHARKYFSHGISGVSAVESGTGQRAVITLTKHQSIHDAKVKVCAENLAELNRLRKLLRVRAGDTGSDSLHSVGAAASTPSGSGGSGSSGQAGGQAGEGEQPGQQPGHQPAAKKARVEGTASQQTGAVQGKPEVIVIE